MQIYRKASLRAGGASHPSRTFGESLQVLISTTTPEVPQFLQKYIARVSFAAPSFPSYASWSGHGRIAWLLPRSSPLAPTYAPSYARYTIPCWSSSKCRNTPRTNYYITIYNSKILKLRFHMINMSYVVRSII